MLSSLPQVKQFTNRWAWFQLSSPAWKPTLLSLVFSARLRSPWGCLEAQAQVYVECKDRSTRSSWTVSEWHDKPPHWHPDPSPSSTPSSQWLWITPHRWPLSARSYHVGKPTHSLAPPHAPTSLSCDSTLPGYSGGKSTMPGLLSSSSTFTPAAHTQVRGGGGVIQLTLKQCRLELRRAIDTRTGFQ